MKKREGEREKEERGREGEEERGEGEGCMCLKYQYTLLQRPASPSTCRMSIQAGGLIRLALSRLRQEEPAFQFIYIYQGRKMTKPIFKTTNRRDFLLLRRSSLLKRSCFQLRRPIHTKENILLTHSTESSISFIPTTHTKIFVPHVPSKLINNINHHTSHCIQKMRVVSLFSLFLQHCHQFLSSQSPSF